ncbi:MAG: adenylosuccinate synthase [Candidatus Electryonea clarkiae]|nr:adenylosuccinate synthase [Candidatus Electryonea clarkiae]MDP8287661.1 adenylosuccinate synthase [Candidatus Electryonea clarkiae]
MAVRVVIGSQWGDEGKGKVVDLLSYEADIVARYQGGPNAGHTVVIEGEQTILHQIPSGIMHPDVVCCLGNGCVISPPGLFEEIRSLEERGIIVDDRLLISEHAHVIMPYHRAVDDASEKAAGKEKIGTTGKGIGPAYCDKYNRSGIRVVDLKNIERLSAQIKKNVRDKNRFLTKYYNADRLDADRIITEFQDIQKKLEPYISNVSLYLDNAIRERKNILIEGAQGTLLDIDHGTYPYVTSSNPTSGAASTGLGIGPGKIEHVLGVLKAYTTRVGNGPFPTEVGEPLQSEFRKLGGEFGATTGRARRCGWFDLVIARYSARISGINHWAVTKLDVLSSFKEIQVCTAYKYGKDVIEEFPSEPWIQEEAVPVYQTLQGWDEDISRVRSYGELPIKCREYLDYIQNETGVSIASVSVGADREATISFR